MLHIVGDVSKAGPAVDFRTGELVLSKQTGEQIINFEVESMPLLPDSSLLVPVLNLPAVGKKVDVTVKVITGRKDDAGDRLSNLYIAVGWEYVNGHSSG